MGVSQDDSIPVFTWRAYRAPIVLGSISISLIIISIVMLVKTSYSTSPVMFSHTDALGKNNINQTTTSAILASIYVDIEGAVKKPGVLRLTAGSRVEDAITSAGGLLKTADTEYIAKRINKAMKVADGMKLYIPFINETSHILNKQDDANNTSHNNDSQINPFGDMSQNNLVSINMSTNAELDGLPGVGPVTAQKIIDNRPYETLEDLVVKKAVGPAVFEKIKSAISL